MAQQQLQFATVAEVRLLTSLWILETEKGGSGARWVTSPTPKMPVVCPELCLLGGGGWGLEAFHLHSKGG